MASPQTFLLNKRRIQRPLRLDSVTVRDFSGGWNVVDNDLNLSSKFLKKMKNMMRGEDGSVKVRYGTRLFADLSAYLDKIINIFYFAGRIIAVGLNGKIAFISSTGDVTVAWDDSWAKNLPGNPKGWSTTPFCSSAVFNGELIICNGVNKPVKITPGLAVSYLVDLATGSNVNTPVARFVKTHDRYLVMAGDFSAEDKLYISASDTAGTWLGDPAPNDAVNVDLGSRVPSGSQAVKGLGRFRDKLVVTFDEAIVTAELGKYVGSDHVPDFDDAIEEIGSISHRAIQTIGENMISADRVGVGSVRRALFTTTVKPERQSELVDPEIQKDMARLTTTAALEDDTFSVYDSKAYMFMLFLPNADGADLATETRGFIYHYNEKLKIDSWSEFTHWKWRAACRSALKRVFFADNTQVYIYGNKDDPIHADFVGAQETFSDDTVFNDGYGFYPVADANDSGVPIPWVWELPWADNGARFNVKTTRYLGIDTVGDARFKVRMFTDNIYNDRDDPGEVFLDTTLFTDGTGFDVEKLSPNLEMEMVGGESPGFGADDFGEYFGGGRPTGDERLYAWTSKHKLYKMQFLGETMGPLSFVSFTLGYMQGSIRR